MLKIESSAASIAARRTQRARSSSPSPTSAASNRPRLEVRYSPTLAGAMVDALPYLADYPYGCTEQTLNRFVPTVITQKILQKMGSTSKAIQRNAPTSTPRKSATPPSAPSSGSASTRNPGLRRSRGRPRWSKPACSGSTEMQLSDGGWGWFSGWGEHSRPPHHGRRRPRPATRQSRTTSPSCPACSNAASSGSSDYQDEQVSRLTNGERPANPNDKELPLRRTSADNLDALVYMVLVDADVKDNAMTRFLYRDRTHLAVYAKPSSASRCNKQQEADEAQR